MVSNSLYWVRTDDGIKHLFDRLYSKPTQREYPKNWLMEKVNDNPEDDKVLGPKKTLFMELVQSESYRPSVPIDIPISFSAEQMALNGAYDKWKLQVSRHVYGHSKFNIEDYLVKPAEELFGEGKRINIERVAQPTYV